MIAFAPAWSAHLAPSTLLKRVHPERFFDRSGCAAQRRFIDARAARGTRQRTGRPTSEDITQVIPI